MKLNNTTDLCIQKTNIKNEGHTFKINACAEAFKILTDNLYENKISTIVRELSCNAWDSHIAAGTSDIPFKIHVPSSLEPWFYIRDYGTGLTQEEIYNIYTTYFQSTKNDSNDFIGAFGLGSKTPLCYTEQFLVTSYKDGVKDEYNIYMNTSGFPEIQHLSSKKTEEKNGLKVYLAVKTTDISDFWSEISTFFKYIPLTPTFVNASEDFGKKEPQIYQNDKLTIFPNDGNANLYAKLGMVLYPVNISMYSVNIMEYIKLPEVQNFLKGIHFNRDKIDTLRDLCVKFYNNFYRKKVIEYEIGTLSVAASRESLSLDKETTQNLLIGYVKQVALFLRKFSLEQNEIKNYQEHIEFRRKYSFATSLFVFEEKEYRNFKITENGYFSIPVKFWNSFINNKGVKNICPNIVCTLFTKNIKGWSNSYKIASYDTQFADVNGKYNLLIGNVAISKLKYPSLILGSSFCYFKVGKKDGIDKLVAIAKKMLPSFIEIQDLREEKFDALREKVSRDYAPVKVDEYTFVDPERDYDNCLREDLFDIENYEEGETLYYLPTTRKILKSKKYNLAKVLYFFKGVTEINILKKVQIKMLKEKGINLIDVSENDQFEYLIPKYIFRKRIGEDLMNIIKRQKTLWDTLLSEKDIKPIFDIEKYCAKSFPTHSLKDASYPYEYRSRMMKLNRKAKTQVYDKLKILEEEFAEKINIKDLMLDFLKHSDFNSDYAYLSDTPLGRLCRSIPSVRERLLETINEKL